MKLSRVYDMMHSHFGHMDWWPMQNAFRPPEFEVCVGAILTQNTSWGNVERALYLMKKAGITTPEKVLSVDIKDLEDAVRPSGFYRQKAERLKIFTEFVSSFGGFEGFRKNVTREDLLKVRGLGPETVDSILLYALSRPYFVIDAYTKRVFTRLGFPDKKDYESWRKFFEEGIEMDVKVYNNFHALIVEQAKTFCRTKPLCSNCFLSDKCMKKL